MYCIVLYCTTLRIKIMDQSQSSVYHTGSKEGSDLEEVSEGGGSGEAPIICPCGTQQSFMGFFVGNFSLQPLHKNHVAQKLPPISDYDDDPSPPPRNTRKSPVAYRHLMTALFTQNWMIFLLSGKLLFLVHRHHVGVDFQSSGQTALSLWIRIKYQIKAP
jgi:hypothetical protein